MLTCVPRDAEAFQLGGASWGAKPVGVQASGLSSTHCEPTTSHLRKQILRVHVRVCACLCVYVCVYGACACVHVGSTLIPLYACH